MHLTWFASRLRTFSPTLILLLLDEKRSIADLTQGSKLDVASTLTTFLQQSSIEPVAERSSQRSAARGSTLSLPIIGVPR